MNYGESEDHNGYPKRVPEVTPKTLNYVLVSGTQSSNT